MCTIRRAFVVLSTLQIKVDPEIKGSFKEYQAIAMEVLTDNSNNPNLRDIRLTTTNTINKGLEKDRSAALVLLFNRSINLFLTPHRTVTRKWRFGLSATTEDAVRIFTYRNLCFCITQHSIVGYSGEQVP